MEDATFIIGAWVITLVAVAGYAVFVVRRGRALSRHATRDEMPWT